MSTLNERIAKAKGWHCGWRDEQRHQRPSTASSRSVEGDEKKVRKHMLYLQYIIRHKWYVFLYACKLGIPWLGIAHDMSKFLPSEWQPYKRYFYGHYEGNALEKTRADFDQAWLRHIHRNTHHWQWWVLHEDSGQVICLPMPDRYLREMIADWHGAGRAAGRITSNWQWYQENADKIQLHPSTRYQLEAYLQERGRS